MVSCKWRNSSEGMQYPARPERRGAEPTRVAPHVDGAAWALESTLLASMCTIVPSQSSSWTIQSSSCPASHPHLLQAPSVPDPLVSSPSGDPGVALYLTICCFLLRPPLAASYSTIQHLPPSVLPWRVKGNNWHHVVYTVSRIGQAFCKCEGLWLQNVMLPNS